MSPEDVVDVVTQDDITKAVERHLRELGMTLEELRDEAERGEFRSREARLLWMTVNHFAQPA